VFFRLCKLVVPLVTDVGAPVLDPLLGRGIVVCSVLALRPNRMRRLLGRRQSRMCRILGRRQRRTRRLLGPPAGDLDCLRLICVCRPFISRFGTAVLNRQDSIH